MEQTNHPETRRLYDDNAYLNRFTANVLACTPAKKQGRFEVVLDQTAFFPEGGGQPADRGTLGGANVLDVQTRQGVITHLTDAPLEAGSAVEGVLDMEHRLDSMQQHSGEHILSGILHRMFGCENVGFHIGQEETTLDTSLPIPPEGLAAAEAEANRIVWADLPVQAEYPAPEVLATLTYRSKKAIDGAVRIVTIPGADCCACCGTHVERTGQIGQIKVMGAMNYKGGTRITLACGGRALMAFSQMLEEQAKLRAQFSAKNGQLAAAAQRQADELAAQKARAAQLEQQVFAYTAAQVQEGDQPVLFVRDLSGDSLRRLCLALSEHTHRPCAVFTQGGQGYAYCLAWNGGDARVLAKAMNAALNGRGGGKPELCSGSVAETDLDKVTAFFQEQEQAGNI